MSQGVNNLTGRDSNAFEANAPQPRIGKTDQKAENSESEAAARAHVEKAQAYRATYREHNRERIRAYKAAYDKEHREEIRRKNRDRERARSQRETMSGEREQRNLERAQARQRLRELNERQQRNRERAREREREWAAAHPEQKRDSIRRWKETHPEKTAEYSKRYYDRHRDVVLERERRRRDAEPEKVAATARDWQQRNRARVTERQRQHREENRDAYERVLRSNRETKALQRRLENLRLPPRKLHRSPARERRCNASAAQEFFERQRRADARRRLQEEYQPLDQRVLDEWRQRSPLARRRMVDLSRLKKTAERAAVQADAIYEDARMDSIARQQRGQVPLDVEAEVRQRLFEAAGGQQFLAAGGDRHSGAMMLEEALEGFVAPVVSPQGSGLIWVPEYLRAGQSISGHWRRRPGS